jgi:hypothetical protein
MKNRASFLSRASFLADTVHSYTYQIKSPVEPWLGMVSEFRVVQLHLALRPALPTSAPRMPFVPSYPYPMVNF